jgi:hypothetical protein
MQTWPLLSLFCCTVPCGPVIVTFAPGTGVLPLRTVIEKLGLNAAFKAGLKANESVVAAADISTTSSKTRLKMKVRFKDLTPFGFLSKTKVIKRSLANVCKNSSSTIHFAKTFFLICSFIKSVIDLK